jgi:bifunctional non-homologous end joining protein LigD
MAKAQAADRLGAYRQKRDFAKTREPEGSLPPAAAKARGGSFVIHKHAARRLHYDLRLEHDGALWSWAVTRGPSLDPDDKRLAVHVEDHPLSYGGFEGTIPAGEYGAGSVIVWDRGTWAPEGDPAKAMAKGHIAFTLDGERLQGGWHLVRLKPRRGESRDNWLLMKSKDDAASDRDILAEEPTSLVSGLTVEEVAEGKPPKKTPPKTVPAGKAGAKKAPAKAAAKPAMKRKAAAGAPAFVPPCLASLKERPAEGKSWIHEVKFDGYRVQAVVADGEARLLTRTGLDWTERFGGDLAAAFADLPCESAVIDGEVVVLNDAGVSSFAALQAALSEGRRENMVYYAFDLLHLDGEDLTGEPLVARKERLTALIEGADPARLRYSEHFAEPGEIMLAHACRMGLEGVISKRLDAPYHSGRRGDWIKAKCTRSQEFVIAGYVPSKAHSGRIGSLVVAYHEDGALKHAGRVGTGYTGTVATALKRRLDGLRAERSPFPGKEGRQRDVVWVEPELACEVEYRTWTADGLLRQAAFKGLREDKPADEIVREDAPAADPEPTETPKRAKKARAPAAPATSVVLSNADKVLWPDRGLTKEGLLAHYGAVWERMEPLVVRRPLSLVRAPDGISRHSFFQKHASPGMGKAIRTVKPKGETDALLYVEDFDGIAALVQMGVVEIHVWGSTIDDLERPDQVIFDLDPGEGVSMDAVREGALAVRDRLKGIGLESFVKLSGGKGFHVTVPLKPAADWAAVKGFSHEFARAMAATEPERYTATLAKKARRGKIFIDYLRNGRGATAVAPYSTRARPGAPFALPSTWKEVEGGIAPNAFTVGDALPARDAWAGFRAAAQPLAER